MTARSSGDGTSSIGRTEPSACLTPRVRNMPGWPYHGTRLPPLRLRIMASADSIAPQ
jgi:hypothetical protein